MIKLVIWYAPLLLLILISVSCDHDLEISDSGLSTTEVQAQINAASDGDVIYLPSGTGYWRESVTVPAGKRITVSGVSSSATKIYSTTIAFILEGYNLSAGGISGSRITQITFEFPDSVQIGGVITARGSGWRIDNCLFVNTGTRTVEAIRAASYSYEGHPQGVIDHNIFNECRILVLGSLALMAHEIWSDEMGLGTNNAVFIEDNSFSRTHGDAVDADYGGRYVFRYNYLTGCYVEAHSVQNYNRAAKSWEVYENEIIATSNNEWNPPIHMRGGTGIIFNNTITGFKRSDENGIEVAPVIRLDNMRSFDSRAYSFTTGRSDGTSPYDENSSVRYVNSSVQRAWPARDQIGRGTDLTTWNDSDDPRNTQMWFPAHAWGNSDGNGTTIEMDISPYMNDPAWASGVETRHIMRREEIEAEQGPVTQFVYNPIDELSNETVSAAYQYDYANEPLLGYSSYVYPHPLTEESAW